METRKQDLLNVQHFIGKVDAELTMILQQLQWDRNHLLEKLPLVDCKYNRNHRIPLDRRDSHEAQCFFISKGYSKEDKLLPDPFNINQNTLIKLSTNDIQSIINKASRTDPAFKRGSKDVEPMSLDRLHQTYTADERRAIHDAVVKAVPSCHDLSDLAFGNQDAQNDTNQKSRVEILAELRNMKRRRTKYRVAAKTRNYSDLLRDVIKTQMEMYSEVKDKQKEVIRPEMSQNKTDNPRFDTRGETSRYKHDSELNKSRDRSPDNRSWSLHSRHNFDEHSKRKGKSDKSYDLPNSSRYISASKNSKNYEDDYKRRKREESSDKSSRHHKGEKGERQYRREKEKSSTNDFLINTETRIKKEKLDVSEGISDVEHITERYLRHDQDETRYRHSSIGYHRGDQVERSKYNIETGSYSASREVNKIHIKQEHERYYETDTSERNIYEKSKYSSVKSKDHYEDTRFHKTGKSDVKRHKYNNQYHNAHETSNKEKKRDEEPRYRRYYD